MPQVTHYLYGPEAPRRAPANYVIAISTSDRMTILPPGTELYFSLPGKHAFVSRIRTYRRFRRKGKEHITVVSDCVGLSFARFQKMIASPSFKRSGWKVIEGVIG